MDGGNSVLAKKDYGGIEFHFAEIMDKKNIRRNQLARRAGIWFEVADRYYNGQIERMDMDVLARICYVLECEVGDVIQYKKSREE